MSDETTNEEVKTENVDASNSVNNSSNKKKKLLWIILSAVVVLGLIGGGIFFANKDKILGDAPAKPVAAGKTIVLPDVTDSGNNKTDKPTIQNDPSAPKYDVPQDLGQYRHVDANGDVTIESPVDGPCAINANGDIQPPANYLHICYYQKNGAVFYTSHSVIGNATGALENIQYLKPGTTVYVAGDKYTVSTVNTYLATKLPDFLFKPGVIALVTCHLDSSVKTWKDFTKTDVVVLKKA